MTHISDTTECRRLARNVVTADFNDTQVQSFQDKEYSFIATMTDKDDWAATDREYGALQLVETRLVAADIIQHYGDTETIPIWTAMRNDALMLLTGAGGIVENMDTETAETEFLIDRTEFKGWGKNTANPQPDRLQGGTVDTESF